MMLLGHGWGCHPIQTASCIHITHIQSLQAHWYAVHRHTLAALFSYTHTRGPEFLVTWVISWNEMMSLGHGWDCHFIQTASTIHIRHVQCVWAHWYAAHRHRVAAQSVIPTLLGSYFGDLGHLWRQNNVIRSWLKLPSYSNCFPYPYKTYRKCLSTLICCQ